METINWLAVLVAGISAFVVGGIWYSPALFGKAWMPASAGTNGEFGDALLTSLSSSPSPGTRHR